jgi:putative endopeptidase
MHGLVTPLRLGGFLAALALALVELGSSAQGSSAQAKATILAQTAPSAIRSALRGFSIANVDPTCKPCQDFFRYAMGGWQANNPIPAAATRWSVLDQLREQNRAQLRDILEVVEREGWPHGSPTQKIADYYASCMNVRDRDAAGIAPIAVYLNAIRDVKDLAELRLETAVLQNIGGRAFFFTGTEGDPRDETHTIAVVTQGGLGLPDRELYFAGDAHAAQIREAYVSHIARYLTLAGDEPSSANLEAREVMTVESMLARASRTRSERRDRGSNYHKLSIVDAQALIPSWDLATFFRDRIAPHVDVVDVEQPDYLRAVDQVLRTTPLADLRAYLRFHLIERAAPALSTAFGEEATAFDSVLAGRRESVPPWNRCVRAVDADLGDALGQLYVAKHFTTETRASAQRLVDSIEAAFREQLASLTWMSEGTRREAIAKLDAVVDKIGFPEMWRKYDTLDIDRGLFITNSLRASLYRSRMTFTLLGRNMNRRFWSMTTPTINASYSAANNDITFPAGILQPPFFSPRYDDATNYGAIGVIIAHELTHAFDDEGRRSDARGNLRDWWSPADAGAYAARQNCIEREFARFAVVGDVHENPKLVAGEALADLGGLQIAYRALERSLAGKPRTKIDGWTPEQRFFLAFAQAYATFERPERIRLSAVVDPHPTGRDRIIGTLSNLPEFALAFHCRAGEPMVRPAAERCALW